MLSNTKCKKILNNEGFFYTDEEIEVIQETLHKLVEIIEKNKLKNRKYEKRNIIYKSKHR